MVSTRQMSIGGSNAATTSSEHRPSTSSDFCSGPSMEYGPARFTRNSMAVYSGASTSGGSSGTIQCYRNANPPPSATPKLLDLPQELIEKIFSYLPFKEICKLRLVCRRIDQISGYLLNSTFSKLQNQMLQRFQEIKSKMPRRESARRSHHLACESDIIETLHMRLTLLQMSFGKHIERRHCCFFPGEILDEVYSILHYIKTTSKLDLPYKVTDELFDLSTMAMEYFKDKIEPNLPEIAYFSTDFLDFSTSFATPNTSKYLESSNLSSDVSKVDHDSSDVLDSEEYVEIPQSNMVLRKRIRKIKQGMKRYNNQLTVLRQELKVCKKKTSEQQKQIADQQKQLADQQKQTLEYATRLDEYDKKNEEISRKFSTLLQELNKCKTELQYWRCKSPATPTVCNACGTPVDPPTSELQALVNQGVDLGGSGLDADLVQLPNASTDHHHVLDKTVEKKTLETVTTNSPDPASRGGKRKSSTDDRVEDEAMLNNKTKKTRRLTKMRSKRKI
ncbi:hypothetical protein ABEB36_006367 [Hypothenemus hampei]|uniref:F-box domain-containing protein n=1 Tax=Hypothenemus hampei TaxID=57062 RepID=A0ABD1EQB5_HYPHA